MNSSLLCPSPKKLQREQEQNHIKELWCAVMQIKQLRIKELIKTSFVSDLKYLTNITGFNLMFLSRAPDRNLIKSIHFSSMLTIPFFLHVSTCFLTIIKLSNSSQVNVKCLEQVANYVQGIFFSFA